MDSDGTITFGDCLRRMRIGSGLTQEALADRAGPQRGRDRVAGTAAGAGRRDRIPCAGSRRRSVAAAPTGPR